VQLLDGSPRPPAGVRAGDVIVELDGRPIEGVGDLQRVMVGEMVGRPVAVGVERDGAIVSLTVTPVELDR
jgi:S1-C subfamily serine protease